jgi:hypothetical protein
MRPVEALLVCANLLTFLVIAVPRFHAAGWMASVVLVTLALAKDIEQTQATMRAVYNGLPGDGYFVQAPGMFHIDFTDLNSYPHYSQLSASVGQLGSNEGMILPMRTR